MGKIRNAGAFEGNGRCSENCQPTDVKFDHDRILALASIRPAPENNNIYHPIDPGDPDIQALAESIREHGVQEPIVVSADGFILSGHRRHAAAQLAGLIEVPCRIHPIRRDTNLDGFVRLLREFNRQRVKSFDEVIREEVIDADPNEAYESLLAHRAQSRVAVEAMSIGTGKKRPAITNAKIPFLNAIIGILNERRAFWPLSDRQVHYALLNNPPLIHASKPKSTYANDLKSYRALTDVVTRARLVGYIPWEAIEDPTRPITLWNVHPHVGAFVHKELDGFLKGFWRNLMQSQPAHIEIIAEKNTLAGILKPVASEYCIPLTTGRGYCSLPPRRAMAERFRKAGKDQLVLLMLTDHDPEGEEIAKSFARSMQGDFEIENIVPIKVALTPGQIERFKLPPQMKAKTTSSNYKKFHAAHGDTVFELEALRPEDLQVLLRETVESVIDREALNAEIEAEKRDAAELAVMRQRILAILGHDARARDGRVNP